MARPLVIAAYVWASPPINLSHHREVFHTHPGESDTMVAGIAVMVATSWASGDAFRPTMNARFEPYRHERGQGVLLLAMGRPVRPLFTNVRQVDGG
jgi:hypothetical protein